MSSYYTITDHPTLTPLIYDFNYIIFLLYIVIYKGLRYDIPGMSVIRGLSVICRCYIVSKGVLQFILACPLAREVLAMLILLS